MYAAHELVKLLDSPVSKGLGTWKLEAEPLGAVARDLFEGGADSVLVASLASIGGMNN